jgi:hypothetical protein
MLTSPTSSGSNQSLTVAQGMPVLLGAINGFNGFSARPLPSKKDGRRSNEDDIEGTADKSNHYPVAPHVNRSVVITPSVPSTLNAER